MLDIGIALLKWLLLYGSLWAVGLAFVCLGVVACNEDDWGTGLLLIAAGVLQVVYRYEIRAFFDALAALVMEPAGL